MSITPSRNDIHWNLYVKSGPVEIWEGKPTIGAWTQWEVRTPSQSRPCEEHQVLQLFNEILIQNNENDT